MPMTNIIELNHVTKKFDDFVAINDMSLTIEKGKIFGFLGPNGAGKSTTIRMIIGVLTPTKGSITVDGLDIVENTEQIKEKIGYMSQSFGLYEDLTVLENLRFYASLYNIRNPLRDDRIEQLIKMANLQEKRNALTKTLSGGWKQRLALSCSLIHKPKILILDEPTAGVDPVSRRVFWKMIYQLAHQGISIIVTTHYMDEAESCDEVAFIFRGEILTQDTPENLIQQEQVNTLEDVFINYVEQETGEQISSSFDKLKFIKAGETDEF
jgi:ABC-2 type transport system ATP-binding protein